MYERDTAGRVYWQALPVILVSLLAGLFAGTVLGSEAMRASIDRVPGILVLLPAFLATRGGVFGSLGARLSSALHQGLIAARFDPGDWRLRNAIVASFANGMIVSVFIAVAAYVVVLLLGRSGSLIMLVGVMVVAGLLSAVLTLSVLVGALFLGYRRGLDPDNLIGPVVTTLGDLFGVVFLLVGIAVMELIL